MKKLIVLVVLFAACNGCGRGWLPLFHGAPCNSCRTSALPAAPCNGCAPGYESGYAGYEGEAIVDSGYYNGQFLGEAVGGAPVPPAVGGVAP